MTEPPLWISLAVVALIAVGALFVLVGSIGLARLPDFYMRLHAPTKATTLGIGGLLLASMVVGWLDGRAGVHELIITLLLFVTAPVSANLLAKAALNLRVPAKAPPPPDLRRD